MIDRLSFLKVCLLMILFAGTVYAEENGALSQLHKIKDIITSELTGKKIEIEKPENNQTGIANKFPGENNLSKEDQSALALENKNTAMLLIQRKDQLDQSMTKNNIWSKIYSNYHTYLRLQEEKTTVEKKISSLKKKKKLTAKEKEILWNYQEEANTIAGKLQLLEEYRKDPFKELLKPKSTEDVPSVGNPIAIVTALSYKKKLLSDQDEYNNRYLSLREIVEKFQEEKQILKELVKLDVNNTHYQKMFDEVNDQLKIYEPVIEIFETSKNVYNKKVDEIKLKLREEVGHEIEKTATIGGILLFFFALFLLGKFLTRRYMANDRLYTTNKVINISFVILLLLILLFSYIENVSYLVTVLGFASAGIAIAMKDWFMSMMGWFVIVIGGTIHVGDRVKFVKNGVAYVGDIVDISMMRMTLHEDVTLTTYMENRRAGRMIFIPNNYIFTDMVANYSHSGLKTVWDGIDFMITFDSDISRAASIAKEVSKKYSKGYTDITRKQLNKLRSSYSIRNTNVEPRILTFIEPYGIKISVWYLTNAYATLTLRSTISQEIIEKIQAEEHISLAFPTQSVYLDKDVRKPLLSPEEGDETVGAQHS